MVRFLHRHRILPQGQQPPADDESCEYRYNEEDDCYYVFDHDDDFQCCAMSAAAANGHLLIVRFLHQFWAGECSRTGWTEAAENGHLDVFKWLCEHRKEGFFARAFGTVASKGDLTMLELLYANSDLAISDPRLDYISIPQGGFQDVDDDPERWGYLSVDAFCGAIKGNQVEAVEWLCEKYPELVDLEALHKCADGMGRACILRWIVEKMLVE